MHSTEEAWNTGRSGAGGRTEASFSASAGHAVADSPHVQTILVIDDDDSLRDTVSLMLEKEGYRKCRRPRAARVSNRHCCSGPT